MARRMCPLCSGLFVCARSQLVLLSVYGGCGGADRCMCVVGVCQGVNISCVCFPQRR